MIITENELMLITSAIERAAASKNTDGENDAQIVEKLILAERESAAVCALILNRCRTPAVKNALSEIRADDARHVRILETSYFLTCGDTYSPTVPKPPVKNAVSALCALYRAKMKAASFYNVSSARADDGNLSDALRKIGADESRHAKAIWALMMKIM